jgi:uncharacterized caspase-like protein
MLAAIVAFFATALPEIVRAETRLALVIGNAKYQRAAELSNPINDARLISRRLAAHGFDVAIQLDADLKGMKRALRDFYGKVYASGPASVALIYYSGHGVQVKGANYLIPIDATIDREADIELEAVRVDSIMELISESGSALNIVILDACRNNPFRGFRAVSRGLAQIDAPSGTLIAFSTAPGKAAADGPAGGNSPYTAALDRQFGLAGTKIEDVFKRVRQRVYADSRGEQVPWESSSLIGDFYLGSEFAPAASVAEPTIQSIPPPAAPKASSVCKGLDEVTCKAQPECAYVIPTISNKTGSLDKPYCRKVAGFAYKPTKAAPKP